MVEDRGNIFLCLGIRRNAAATDHRRRPRIVGGESERDVAIESLQKLSEISGTAFGIAVWIARIYAQPFRCCRHQLHQAACAFGRDYALPPMRFLPGHGSNKCICKALPLRSCTERCWQSRP